MQVVMELLEAFLIQDEIYQKDIADACWLQEKYEQLELSKEQRMLINDYIACLETASHRKCEVAIAIGKTLSKLRK